MIKRDFRLTVAIYIILLFGAFWNITGWLGSIMPALTGPTMIFISLVAIYSTRKKDEDYFTGFGFINWYFITVTCTVFVEWIGVHTGQVFGYYVYTDVVQPQIAGVPIAIGMSWAATCIGAAAIIQRIPFLEKQSIIIKSFIVGFMMMLLDLLLEPVAVELNYWTWEYVMPGVKNYIAWWLIGFSFAYPLLLLLEERRVHTLAVHTYLGQILYFFLIIIF